MNLTELLITAAAAYAGTNIDDIFLGMLFFAQAETKHDTVSVVCGKFLGIGVIVLLSLLGAFGLSFIPRRYLGLPGIVPILIGIRELFQRGSDDKPEETKRHGSLLISAAAVTLANGGDNLGVYIPLFAGYSPVQLAVCAAVFAFFTGVWCVLSKKLADLPGLRQILLRYKHIAVPAVLILLGCYVILRSLI